MNCRGSDGNILLKSVDSKKWMGKKAVVGQSSVSTKFFEFKKFSGYLRLAYYSLLPHPLLGVNTFQKDVSIRTSTVQSVLSQVTYSEILYQYLYSVHSPSMLNWRFKQAQNGRQPEDFLLWYKLLTTEDVKESWMLHNTS